MIFQVDNEFIDMIQFVDQLLVAYNFLSTLNFPYFGV